MGIGAALARYSVDLDGGVVLNLRLSYGPYGLTRSWLAGMKFFEPQKRGRSRTGDGGDDGPRGERDGGDDSQCWRRGREWGLGECSHAVPAVCDSTSQAQAHSKHQHHASKGGEPWGSSCHLRVERGRHILARAPAKLGKEGLPRGANGTRHTNGQDH